MIYLSKTATYVKTYSFTYVIHAFGSQEDSREALGSEAVISGVFGDQNALII